MTVSALDLFSAKPKITKMMLEPLDDFCYVREFTMSDRHKIQNYAREDINSAIGYNIIFGICDHEGNRIFTEEDYEKILELPEETFTCLFAAVMEANKADEKEVAKN